MGVRKAPFAEKAAWRLYMNLRDRPGRDSACELARWLRLHPSHPAAFDRALTVWALAGATLVVRKRRGDHPPPGGIQ